MNPLSDSDTTFKTSTPSHIATIVVGIIAGLLIAMPVMLSISGPRQTGAMLLITLALLIPALWRARDGRSAKSTLR